MHGPLKEEIKEQGNERNTGLLPLLRLSHAPSIVQVVAVVLEAMVNRDSRKKRPLPLALYNQCLHVIYNPDSPSSALYANGCARPLRSLSGLRWGKSYAEQVCFSGVSVSIVLSQVCCLVY